jgi:hypothetical protein
MQYAELFHTFTGIGLEQQDKLDRLASLTRKYPYCSAFPFFQLKETGLGINPALEAKAALYSDNPFLLFSRMHETSTPDKAEAPEENGTATIAAETTDPQTELVQKPAPIVEEAPLVFEPLFASDYFASQGIKLTDEAMGQDKLGKQLRSFTGWLKTMKKIQAAEGQSTTAPLDLSVQQLAEKSNQEAEIITESMAEALVAQGKTKKAIDVYEKLSLRDPAKIAYFAVKIDTLKDK